MKKKKRKRIYTYDIFSPLLATCLLEWDPKMFVYFAKTKQTKNEP